MRREFIRAKRFSYRRIDSSWPRKCRLSDLLGSSWFDTERETEIAVAVAKIGKSLMLMNVLRLVCLYSWVKELLGTYLLNSELLQPTVVEMKAEIVVVVVKMETHQS